MHLLKIGSHGEGVNALQQRLRAFQPGLAVDGLFGTRTERAVRIAQRRLGLYPPDGIAGRITMAGLARVSGSGPPHNAPALQPASPRPAPTPAIDPGAGDPGPLRHAINPARRRARENPMPAGVASPVAGMRMSRAGRRFIYNHEAQRGVSNRLHHPSAGSGVTIGPGYDMKDRARDEVARDLAAVGVSPDAAAEAGKGAGLSGARAGQFVKNNKSLFDLTPDQEVALLEQILPHYERMVQRAIRISLHQQEFDALVSYAYNPGGGWRKTTDFVNAHDLHAAMLEIKRHVTSKGEVIRSLVIRREAESRMFFYGEYR